MSPRNSMGSIPPPPEQHANLVDPPSQTNSNIALHTVCLVLVTICLGLRLFTRYFVKHWMGIDDLFCILAYFLTIAFSALLLWGDLLGLDRHMWDVSAAQFSKAQKALNIAEYVYMVLTPLIKLSCLLFYRRVFSPTKRTLIFIHAGIAVVTAAYTALFFAVLFQCVPIEKTWNGRISGHCIKGKLLPYFSGTLNIITDIYVLVVPIPCVWGLDMKWTRKIRTLAIFGLGIFVCTSSVVRLGMTSVLYTNQDRTWNVSHIEIWAVIEVNIGLVCACLLALPPFFSRYGPRRFGWFLDRLASRLLSRLGKKTTGWNQTTRSSAAYPSRDEDMIIKEEASSDGHGSLNPEIESLPENIGAVVRLPSPGNEDMEAQVDKSSVK